MQLTTYIQLAIALAASSYGLSIEPRASCTFTSTSALASGKGSCSSITLQGIAVPAGQTLDLTGLKSGTSVTFAGTTTFGYKEWEGPLISADGSITITGASGHLIDCDGARWWDSKGSNGGKTKPKTFFAHNMSNAKITNLNVKNTPVQGFSINGAKSLTLDHITINNKDGDSNGGHNTDAFDVGSSTTVTISNSNVQNQDDCLAVNSGSDIHFTGNTCSGGHGISIGSVGGRSDNKVDGVYVSGSSVSNSENGVRIKTVSGATGSVNNVHYTNVKLSNISKYGIVIEQDYENGGPTGTPTTGVPITNLEVSGVTGSVSSSATEVYILCGKGSCSGWKWSGNSISGGKKSTKCANVPSPASC
ncbi:glycoside hydrolase family 28 protein [Acaromyces ingoldii]|uniref:endo-polygalacturonase n=1 Tax=Acaromyces ingoldii TaxID=215250 RepID=A0A316YF21_9BASI|nr:glycoside hydrolase family 28 protein [Acaromyces ingoldii]PWN87238.1 glycoside hydrolase family 28 protein [Acaromyces ingoldii]